MSKKKDSLKPWLSRPAVNRSVTLPLTRPLTQRLSNLNEFHPNELDPYLLFDARDSMVGTLENPTLDLDPSKPDTLNVITATRSGTATYTDVNGNIATAAADTVRVDHVDGVPMILVEPSATNLLTYSEDFSQWQSLNSTLNAAQTTSPDNTINGSSLQINSGGYLYVTIASSHGVGDSVTFSCFVKSPLQKLTWGGATANGTDVYSYEDVGNGWYRQILTRTFSSAGSIQPMFNESQAGSDVFYIWGAQLETGSVATSYIPTSGSTVVRSSDDLVISGSAFSDFYNSSEGTFYVEAVDRQATGSSHAYLGGQDTTRLFLYNYDDIPNLITYDGANDYQLGSIVSNQLFRGAVSYKTGVSPAPSVLSLSFNGTTTSDQPYSENFSTTNILKIGSGYSKVFSGHFRRILYWPYHSDRL